MEQRRSWEDSYITRLCFGGPVGSLSYSQDPENEPYYEQDKSIPHHDTNCFFKVDINVILPSKLW
jgi:hypothetical protein